MRRARAGTLDALRDRRKLRIASVVGPIVAPLFAILNASILAYGIIAGSLKIPMRHNDQIVHWASNPVGFILVASIYFVAFALFS